AALVVRLSWTLHSLWDVLPPLFVKELWPVDKNNLAPLRLITFFTAVVLVTAHVPPTARFLASRAARPLVLCGQQSLEIFCLGILLSALGHFVLAEYDPAVQVQLAVNIVGIAIMFATAKMIDWYKRMDRLPAAAPAAARPRREGTGG
ncbi:MAG TPA: OpgC domain-containing protein, partial [Stellaceae bacterium]|nr:OpgC domain-containing protein [Stellaceae bacterium]